MKKIKIFFENIYYIYIRPFFFTFQSESKKKIKKDTFIGEFILAPCTRFKLGDTVIAPRGIASILKVINEDWISMALSPTRHVEHKKALLYQIFVKIKNPITHKIKIYPLRFQDYEYIRYTNLPLHYKVQITNKGVFAKLADEEVKRLGYMLFFNKHIANHKILDNLEKAGYQIIKNS